MKNTTFSARQKSIIAGSLLGDGHLTNQRYGNSSFVKNQCVAHREYLDWHAQQFGSMACPIKDSPNKADGKTYYRSTIRLKANPVFSLLRKIWYPNGKKSVPPGLILNPLMLAIWYFDDGSNIVQARRASFATYCFTRAEVQSLADQVFKRFGVKCFVNKKNVLIVRSESYKRFIDIIRPYMLWSCFEHKIAYRESLASPSCKKDIEKVVAWHQKGESVESIARQLGVSRTSVYNQIQKHRIRITGLSAKLSLSNTSGVKGVCFDKSRNKWMAFRRNNGRTVNLGRFITLEEARLAVQSNPVVPLPNTCG